MAAPTTITPVAPDSAVGIQLWDGYQTLIGFGEDPNICLWIVEVTPPGLEGGEPIDQTNMHNTTWRTKLPRSLVDCEEMSLVVHYDPVAYDECLAILNKHNTANSSITIQFPDGSTLDFWGYLRSFKPQALQEGQKPTANVVLVPTNWDPVNSVEAAPVMTEVAGT